MSARLSLLLALTGVSKWLADACACRTHVQAGRVRSDQRLAAEARAAR